MDARLNVKKVHVILLKHSCNYPCAWYQYLKIDYIGKTVCALTCTGLVVEKSSECMAVLHQLGQLS